MEWYKVLEDSKEQDGNQAKPSQNEVNSWRAAAIESVSADDIIKDLESLSYRRCCSARTTKLCNDSVTLP